MLVIPLLISFVTGVRTLSATTVPVDTQNILLHKRIIRDKDYIDNFDGAHFQNDGQQVTGQTGSEFLSLSEGLDHAKFLLVDITVPYLEMATEEGRAEAQSHFENVKQFNFIGKEVDDSVVVAPGYSEGKVVRSGITGETKPADITEALKDDDDKGLLLFKDVPVKSNNKDAIYLIVETEIVQGDNVDIHKWAEVMLVAFPVMTDDDNIFDGDYLHLYPKNIGYARDPYFLKVGRNLAGDYVSLPGAEFVMYRLNEAGNREYLIAADAGLDAMNHVWTSDVTLDETNNADYDSIVANGVTIYESDARGVTSMGGRLLAAGTYYFEEINAPEGFLLTNESQRVEVIIPTTWNDTVQVNGQVMREPEPTEAEWTALFKQLNFNDMQAEIWADIPVVYNDELPTVEKNIDSEKDDFAYGEVINYSLMTQLPQFPEMYTKLQLIDNADSRLSLVSTEFEVSVSSADSDDVYLSAAQVASLLKVEKVANSFKADINLDYVNENKELLAGKQLVVNYQMLINEGTTPDTALVNKATLNFTHSGRTISEETENYAVFTGGRRFVKVDLADVNIKLGGAEFVVKNAQGRYLVVKDGLVQWVTNQAEAKVLTSNTNGYFEIQGLSYGSYQLEEIKAPTGYNLSKEAIAFDISAGTYLIDEEPTVTLAISNVKSKPLPQTGQISTTWLIAVGATLVIVAVSIYLYKKKSNQI